MNRRFFRLATALSAAAAMLICGASAQAGVFSLTPFVSDATSGVSPANTYTHLIDWLGPGAVVNGVAFAAAPSQLGPNYALGSVPNALPDGSFNTPPFNVTVPPGDGFNSMFKSFFYGGGFPETVALFGLTPGKTYSTRFYSDPWGGPRVQDVESNGNRIVYDEDAVTQYLDYTFTATDTKNVVSFTIANGGSMHQYALSNQEVAAPLRPLPFVRATTLFNTGVDANGVPLPNGASDPHYVLTLNPDNTGPTPLVQGEGSAPIPPWVGSTATGKWIGPQANTGGSAGGVYIYDLQFDLTGIDETQIQIRGDWSTDNTHAPPHGILLNGNLIAGTQDPDQFDRRAPFTIQRGNPAFQPGINTLSFILENQGAGFTGLKVDGLRGLAPAADSEWIADLFSTGVDNAHVPLPAGSPDPHWTVNGAGPATAQTNHPAWAENGTGSSWISTVADGQAPILATQYVFETTFTIAANLDPSTAIILGRMAADNVVDEVFLNGVPLGISHVGFDTMVDFTIDSGFVSGTNTLTVLMSNLPPDGPGGFRMELDGFASIPEPSSVVLMGLAGLGLAVVARRRRLG